MVGERGDEGVYGCVLMVAAADLDMYCFGDGVRSRLELRSGGALVWCW